MGKNRIKNLRTITVDGHEYKWMVDYRGTHKRVRIWKDKTNMIYEHVDNEKQGVNMMGQTEWPLKEQVQPSDIENIIRVVTR